MNENENRNTESKKRKQLKQFSHLNTSEDPI